MVNVRVVFLPSLGPLGKPGFVYSRNQIWVQGGSHGPRGSTGAISSKTSKTMKNVVFLMVNVGVVFLLSLGPPAKPGIQYSRNQVLGPGGFPWPQGSTGVILSKTSKTIKNVVFLMVNVRVVFLLSLGPPGKPGIVYSSNQVLGPEGSPGSQGSNHSKASKTMKNQKRN